MPINESPVNVYALGGLGEVGKNTYCFETERSIILVDAGVRFPEATLPGSIMSSRITLTSKTTGLRSKPCSSPTATKTTSVGFLS